MLVPGSAVQSPRVDPSTAKAGQSEGTGSKSEKNVFSFRYIDGEFFYRLTRDLEISYLLLCRSPICPNHC